MERHAGEPERTNLFMIEARERLRQLTGFSAVFMSFKECTVSWTVLFSTSRWIRMEHWDLLVNVS